ncbi:hypothetical protein ES288_D09G136900v1 [Gossypium darwinii]|uniref:Uncharacterized protein n=1 Tax=Gossypium darwinii TaxID=34276 RepID=A0A5D2B927_GOSDA|nr:hypothetical protein GOBAR_DD27144 [Gossypium barbadense]TYG53787.1 hypothetical protein ES288_D09G136900v1 [Gossypium darwinii]
MATIPAYSYNNGAEGETSRRLEKATAMRDRGILKQAIKISTIPIPDGPSKPNSSVDCSTANALLVEVKLATLSFCMVNVSPNLSAGIPTYGSSHSRVPIPNFQSCGGIGSSL